jgi:hypothetical protein
MLRRIVGFLVATAAMIVMGSLAHSIFVQNEWAMAAGLADGTAPASLPMTDRINWIGHDLIGLQPIYGVVCAIALFVAFLAAGLVARVTGLRPVVFAVAGAAAIFVLFASLKFAFGTVGVFGARGDMGLGAQMLAGLLAGLLFAILTAPVRRSH